MICQSVGVYKFNYFINVFAKKFGVNDEKISQIYQEVQNDLNKKELGGRDSKLVLDMKGLIRQGEAVRAAVVTGVKEDNIYFLEMPFYETGTIKKSVINEKDIKIV